MSIGCMGDLGFRVRGLGLVLGHIGIYRDNVWV